MYPEEVRVAWQARFGRTDNALNFTELSIFLQHLGIFVSSQSEKYLRDEYVRNGKFEIEDVTRIVTACTNAETERLAVWDGVKVWLADNPFGPQHCKIEHFRRVMKACGCGRLKLKEAELQMLLFQGISQEDTSLIDLDKVKAFLGYQLPPSTYNQG